MLKAGQEIYVNGKWWFDIVSIEGEIVKCRVEYKESKDGKSFFKNVKLPSDKITLEKDTNRADIDEKWLKKEYGSLIDRLVKSKDVYSLLEDADANCGNTAGMGAVSMPGLSGTPGIPGTAGSGDLSRGYLGPAIKMGTYGISDLSKNIKTLKKLAKKGHLNKMGVKKPLLNILKEDSNAALDSKSESDFKSDLFDFLNYPWDSDHDIEMCNTLNEWKEDFNEISSERIVQYLRDVWNLNKSLINSKCTDNFINRYMTLANIES